MQFGRLTDDEKRFIRNNHNEMTPALMSTIISRDPSTIYSFMSANKLSIHKEKKQDTFYLKEPTKRIPVNY